jgi:hypothetical protein
MQQTEKGECENLILRDLEAEGYLALFLVHTLVGQPAEQYRRPMGRQECLEEG